MKFTRLGMIAATAAAGALLLTACNDDVTDAGTTASATASDHAASGHHGAGDGSEREAGRWDKNAEDASFFGSLMNGANEVPVKGGPAVGDKDGQALALMRIQGNEVSYAFTFTGTGTPTLGHLHKGVKGVNGDVKIPFFTEALEDGTKFAYGTVTVRDKDLLERIKANPENWYFNLHTQEFPGGAVRGQAYRLAPDVHVPDTITAETLSSLIRGAAK